MEKSSETVRGQGKRRLTFFGDNQDGFTEKVRNEALKYE